MPIRLLHFADVHLGVENYGRINPQTGLNSRFEDFARTLDRVVDYAVENRIDLAVFAGDAYKNREPTPTHQRTFAKAMRKLSHAGIPTIVLVGNHDVPNTRGRAHAVEVFRVLDVPHVIVADAPDLHRLETRSGPVQVITLPYRRPSLLAEQKGLSRGDHARVLEAVAEEYGEQLKRLAEGLDLTVPTVLTGHLSVAGARTGSERSMLLADEPVVPLSLLLRPELGLDYVALGHMHKQQDLNPRGYPAVVYSGSLERVDFGEEDDEKGFVVVDLNRGASTYEFVPVNARRFVTVECDLISDDPEQDLAAAISTANIEGAVVRLRYRVPEEKKLHLSARQLNRALAGAFCIGRIERQVTRPEFRQRDPHLTEALDTLQALERYLNLNQEKLAVSREEVMAYGQRLIEAPINDEVEIADVKTGAGRTGGTVIGSAR